MTNTTATNTAAGPILSATWYNRLKWFTLIFLPAFSALYFGLGAVWNFPAGEQVVGTCAVLAVFLGTVLGISGRNYTRAGADGSIDANIVGDNVVLGNLVLPDISAEELAAKKRITIQVNPNGPSQ